MCYYLHLIIFLLLSSYYYLMILLLSSSKFETNLIICIMHQHSWAIQCVCVILI